MAQGWKFVVFTPAINGTAASKEWVIVAISDRVGASEKLRALRDQGAEIIHAGEASSDLLEWLNIKPGEIFKVMKAER